MAEKLELRYFHFLLDNCNFYFENILLRLEILYALKCLHRQAMMPLVYQKQSLKVSVQSVPFNCVNSEKVFQISLQYILLS